MKARLLLALALLTSHTVFAKTVKYDLTATRGKVNLSGKQDVNFALRLNGQIPGPTLEFTEGDDAEITVKNEIENEELSIHWHGILLDNEMDGVPYVTTPPIKSGESYIFKFKVRQNGTYWYHSHTNVQEQKGLLGAIVIQPKKPTIPVTKDVVAVISDWSDENATDILKNLRKDGDYYLYKKGTMRSWWGAIQAGKLGNYLYNEFTRMGGMDLSDVGYDAFLINGKRELQLTDAKPGDVIRLRLINASGSSYFYASFGQAFMKVIAADGIDVEPVQAKEILLGMAETYDILFTVPDNKSYQLLIQAQDGTGSASAWVGSGEKVFSPVREMPDMYATMDHSAHAGHEGHEGHGGGGHHEGHQAAHMEHMNHAQHMDHAKHQKVTPIAPPVQTLTVDGLRALQPTSFPEKAKVREIRLELGGDMERYVWYINGKSIHQDRTIVINEGEVVRYTFVNQTMMHHPMHFHGHFFRVVNAGGDLSPLKHTVDVPPHSQRTIEFLANEPGEWMLHCHNLYHMKTGMARVVKYSTFTPKKEIADWQKQDPHLHDHIYYAGLVEGATNHAQGRFRATRTWDMIDARMETRQESGTEWEWEGDLLYRRYFSQFLNFAGGVTAFHDETRATVGVGYTLPMLIETQLLIDHKGELRLDLDKKFQWTKSVFSQVEVTLRQDLATEYEVSLMYGPDWHWSGGVMLTEASLGAGLEYRF